MDPTLVTNAETRTLMVCEVCGLTVPKRPWPQGWIGCGRSRWRIKRDAADPSVAAHWCPSHEVDDKPNLTSRELRALRERLLEAERNAEPPNNEPQVEQVAAPEAAQEVTETATIKWSARREGLVPMRMNPNEAEAI